MGGDSELQKIIWGVQWSEGSGGYYNCILPSTAHYQFLVHIKDN